MKFRQGGKTVGYVIADYNRKGGIGKTNSLINIAAQLAMNGKKVIVIDGDSQMNLTQFLFAEDESVYEDGLLKSEVDTLYEVLEQDLNIFNAIHECSYSAKRKWRNKFRKVTCKFDAILGSGDMDYFTSGDTEVIKRHIDRLKPQYDYILIDFPPAHSQLTMLYLAACDYVIVPMHLAKESSIAGYDDLVQRCRETHESYGNDTLQILGAFYINVQMYKSDQKKLYEESMEEEIRESLRLFTTTIRHDYGSVQYSEGLKEPLCICCGSAEITKDYKKLVKEIEDRIKEERSMNNGEA